MLEDTPYRPTKFNSGIIAYRLMPDTDDMIEVLHFCGFEKDEINDEDIESLHLELLTDPTFGLQDGDYELGVAGQEILAQYNKILDEQNYTISLPREVPDEN